MTTLHLFYLILVIIPILYMNKLFDLPISKRVLYSVARMVLQLSILGIFLQFLFDLNHPLINLAYVLIMMFIAAFSVTQSTRLRKRQYLIHIFVAVVVPNLIMLFYFNKVAADLDNLFEARHFIPVAGMLLGNTLTGNIISINNFYDQLKDNEKIYYYTLAMSASRREALKPYFRQAVLSSINPMLATMETIGLVSLPGMMTGQLLGGAIPLTAIKYQIAIMVAIFTSRYLTATFALWMTSKTAFDDYDRLVIERH